MQNKQSNRVSVQGANTLSEFTFGNSTVRTITINESPYFVLTDVCKALQIKDSRQVAESLDDDERALGIIHRPHVNSYKAWCVNESGLYHLIFISRKPEAKAFRKWVTSEVLPALRTQGEFKVQSSMSNVQSADVALTQSIHSLIENKALLSSMFALADNIGRVSNNYRRKALLRNLNHVRKCLSL